MSADFDPYRKWLGIPPDQQPPNHYRLLGIGVFESDPDTICNAADRQMSHVRTYQSGRYSQVSQEILNELSAARVCLLDPQKKSQYDEQLRQEMAAREAKSPLPAVMPAKAGPEVVAPPAAPPVAPPVSPLVAPRPVTAGGYASPSTRLHKGRRKRSRWQVPVVALVIAAAGLAVVAWRLSRPGEEDGAVSDLPSSRVVENGKRAEGGPASKPSVQRAESAANRRPKRLPRRGSDSTRNGPSEIPGLPDEDFPGVARAGSKIPDTVGEKFGPAAQPGPSQTAGTDSSEPASVTRSRKPVPAAETLKAAEQQIKSGQLKVDFEGRDRAALAQKLLQQAGATADDATAYGLLRLAQEAGIEAGKADIALGAADQLGRQFDVDAVAIKMATLDGLVEVPSGAAEKKLLVEKILTLVDEAMAADDFALADRLAEIARSAAGKTRDGALLRIVAARTADLRQRKEAYRQVEKSLEALKRNPDDPEANEQVGRYSCLVKGDWAGGLPRLAKAADAGLKQMAAADLAQPDDPTQQAALAGRWWELAKSDPGPQQDGFRRRAAHWYKLALPGLSGPTKETAQSRLGGAGDAAAPATPSADVPEVKGLECREPGPKAALLLAYGGSAAGEAAVERALAWLTEHQNTDGSWSFDLAGAKCKGGDCPNPGTLNAPNAATALAMLPLLAANHNGRHGKYRKNALAGIQFLRKRMVPGRGMGMLYESQAGEMPSHALGTIALCEAFAVARDKNSRAVAQAAVNFVAFSQNEDGGWGNRPKVRDDDRPGPSNMIAFGWNLAALHTARWAGLEVNDQPFQKAGDYLDDTWRDGSNDFRRARSGSASEAAVTAVGFLSRMYLGWQPKHPELTAYVVTLQNGGPSASGDFLFDFFASSVMRECGGPAWKKWNTAMLDTLLAQQATAGHQAGSWYQSGREENGAGGRLFCTALAALALEVYYRNPPLYPQ